MPRLNVPRNNYSFDSVKHDDVALKVPENVYLFLGSLKSYLSANKLFSLDLVT